MSSVPFSLLALALVLCSLLMGSSRTFAGWNPNGVHVSTLAGSQFGANVISDGLGGWYVSWLTGDDYGYVMFLQHLDAQGVIWPGWPEGGIVVCDASGLLGVAELASDGLGGVVLGWEDYRDLATKGSNIYLHRVLPDGQFAPGWPANGLPICTAAGEQWGTRVLNDDNGGIFVAWNDQRTPGNAEDVYAIRVNLNGLLDPAWPPAGLPVKVGLAAQIVSSLQRDEAGGAFLVWGDVSPNYVYKSYAVRLTNLGSLATGWQQGGTLIADPGFAVSAIPDGQGGVFVALGDNRTRPPSEPEDNYVDVYAQHVLADGTLAPGWPLDAKPICTAFRQQFPIAITPDAMGGFYMAWTDYRNYFTTASDIYAHRLTASGDPAVGWPVDGVRASVSAYFEFDPAIAITEVGGLLIAYQNYNAGHLFVQEFNADGTLKTEAEPSGHRLTSAPTFNQERVVMARDQYGNVVVVWDEVRTEPNDHDIFAQRIFVGGPTATLVALVKIDAAPDRVRLEWHATGDPVRGTRVYRSADAVSWEAIGEPTMAGGRRIMYEDRSVSAGSRYAYRLGYSTVNGEDFTAASWVDVPADHRFALAGARPNPVVDDLIVHFSLRSAAPAQLDLFDLAGRTVASTSLSSPLPGNQHVRVLDGGQLDAGVYWLRLRQGTDVAKSRVVVMR